MTRGTGFSPDALIVVDLTGIAEVSSKAYAPGEVSEAALGPAARERHAPGRRHGEQSDLAIQLGS